MEYKHYADYTQKQKGAPRALLYIIYTFQETSTLCPYSI